MNYLITKQLKKTIAVVLFVPLFFSHTVNLIAQSAPIGPGGGPYCAIIAMPVTNLTNAGFSYEIVSMGEKFPADNSVSKWYESTVKDLSTNTLIGTGPSGGRFSNSPGYPLVIDVTDLKEDTSYEVFVRFFCDEDQLTEKSTTKTITVRTLKYTDNQDSPDEEPSAVVGSSVIDKEITPPTDTLDCDGISSWSDPSSGPRVNSKICPPLTLGAGNEAKGGKPRADSQLHIYGRLSADKMAIFKGLSSENLKTPTGVPMKLCSNNVGKIVICGGSSTIKSGKDNQTIRFNGSDWIGTDRVSIKKDYDLSGGNLVKILIGYDFNKIDPDNTYANRIALLLNGNLQLLSTGYNTTVNTGIIEDAGAGKMSWKDSGKLINNHFLLVQGRSGGGETHAKISCPSSHPIVFSGGGICHSGMVEWDDSTIPGVGTAGDLGGRIMNNGYTDVNFGFHSAYNNDPPDRNALSISSKYMYQCTSGSVTAYAICMRK